MKNSVSLMVACILLLGCQAPPERNCQAFKTGSFEFQSVIDGKETKSSFTRTKDLEIEYFEGKQDSATVRWVNDCEYVLKRINPRNKAEEKPILIKILTTSETSYTFEYGVVGDAKRLRGTATKINKQQ
ncbi:Hypothetical protein I595_215 [Croceitalea dokdonensis DOKDO 023]|uniref:DNA topoisomerase IV subunit A n=1 Tax=Croceitalea dokdonensis DOKDO 023 TaxID=1300341 RepID=A0A0P7AI66_9FLAO|nr:hypothetical protein [Croceitalea dokdonensis]KPM33312.1 Hypothetical protein I595_215 [Croceitalea dokdonensis DOKDO 023]